MSDSLCVCVRARLCATVRACQKDFRSSECLFLKCPVFFVGEGSGDESDGEGRREEGKKINQGLF